MTNEEKLDRYTAFVRSMPRPPPTVCSVRLCNESKIKFSPLFCALHELAWIAHTGEPSHRLDSTQIAGAMAWAKGIQI